MEALDSGKITLETQIPCSSNAASMGGSQIWLDTTETLSVDEMLKAICVVSANDCCVAMAEYLAGSEELFVEQMNAKAKELGSDYIVVGRSITGAEDPVSAYRKCVKECYPWFCVCFC